MDIISELEMHAQLCLQTTAHAFDGRTKLRDYVDRRHMMRNSAIEGLFVRSRH